MPGLLSRSKSMRLLKGHRKDIAHHDQAVLGGPLAANSQTDVRIFRSATPNLNPEANIETTNMPARPSTSGGPGDRRTQFHMKTNLPQFPRDLPIASPAGSTAVISPFNVTDSREGIIGIALGSPTYGSHWNQTPQATSTNFPSANEPMESITLYDGSSAFQSTEPAKSKLSRWKSLFKKTGPPPQQDKPSFYQLAQPTTTTRVFRADSHHDEEDSTDSGTPPKQLEDRGRLPSPPTFKPDIRASRKYGTEEAAEAQSGQDSRPARTRALTAGSLPVNPRMSVQRSATTPLPVPTVAPSTSAIPQVVVSQSTQSSGYQESDRLLLDVNIPDIKMERYSVMFSNLLQTTSTRSSSLLARRQGNAEKLKPLNALSVKESQESPMDYKIQRRATSPTVPTPSPRLSLFPNTSNNRAASPRSSSVPRMRALNRSKTMQDKSPLHQTFRTAEDTVTSPELIIQKHSPITSLAPPAVPPKSHEVSKTPVSASSFTSGADSVTLEAGTAGASQRLHLDSREPEWEICRKPSTTIKSPSSAIPNLSNESNRLPKVTKFSALSSNPASAPLDAPSPLQRISSMRSPPTSAKWVSERGEAGRKDGEHATGKAMVGVARSISVSRANSPRAIVKTATDASSPERIVERQALTPTMVEVRNRRSQRVQLVDA